MPSDLKFASLQSEQALKLRQVLSKHASASRDAAGMSALDTVILVEHTAGEERVYLMSDAILRALVSLGGVWRMMAVFYAVPRPLRDLIYRWIARNRYQWFGKRDSCRLPTAAEKSRFLG